MRCVLRYCMWMALLSALTGCHAGLFFQEAEDPAVQAIQEKIERRLAGQRESLEPGQTWQEHIESDYQDSDSIEVDRNQVISDSRQVEAVKWLRDGQPLSLADCLIFGLNFNDSIQAKRAEIHALGGQRLVVKSRFLPELSYTLDHQWKQRAETTTDQAFLLNQTLFEFGRENAQDIQLRADERSALFSYESTVSNVLSDIRRVYFTVILRRHQLQVRQESLASFQQRYEEIRRLEQARKATEIDVLTRRLNVLNEQQSINSLLKEILRLKSELLLLIGLPVGRTDITLAGDLEDYAFNIDEGEAVSISLRRSTSIAQARALVYEQARLAHRIAWEGAPDVDFRAGWKGNDAAAGSRLSSSSGLYSFDAFGEGHIDPPSSGFDSQDGVMDTDEEGWFISLDLDLPLFDGLETRGKVMREMARLEKRRHELRNAIDATELNVRRAYQTMLEEKERLMISQETVEISRQRFKIQERLNEIGEVKTDELETFRNRFFSDQDSYFNQQINLINAQEQLRLNMRYFEPIRSSPEEVELSS